MRIVVLLIITLATSCATREDRKGKSLLHRLNGENVSSYSEDLDFGVIKLGTATYKRTSISGKVLRVVKGNELAVRKGTVILVNKDGKQEAESQISHDGIFRLFARVPDGKYSVKLLSNIHKASTKIAVNGFKVENVLLFVENK